MNKNKAFTGTFTALATPFKNNEVDIVSLEKLIQQQNEAGINGFIVNGTTGESPTLSTTEVKKIFDCVRANTKSSQSIILGVGTNSTSSTIEWVQRASEWKAHGALAVVPYYNKPPQRGLVNHFRQVAAASQIPVILYNVPGRTIQGLSVESIETLSKHEMILGIKESTGDLKFLAEILEVVPKDFSLLSGDDGTAVEFCLNGGDGLIGVMTHVIPKKSVHLISRALEGDRSALEEFNKFIPLVESLYTEANPIPVKMALHLIKIFETADLRSPLVTLSQENTERIKKCLQDLQQI